MCRRAVGREKRAHHYREDQPDRKGFRSRSPYHANGCGQANHLRAHQQCHLLHSANVSFPEHGVRLQCSIGYTETYFPRY